LASIRHRGGWPCRSTVLAVVPLARPSLAARITLDPCPLYLAAVLGNLATSKFGCDKLAGRAAVAGSLAIPLTAMPALDWSTTE